jgi:hypothetical protein
LSRLAIVVSRPRAMTCNVMIPASQVPPITCMSCHNAHASNFTYMLIKTPAAAGESLCKTCGLCLECHHNMFP